MLSNRMLTHTADVMRQGKNGRVIKAVAHKANVPGSLQPLSNKAALEYSLIPGRGYAFYTNERDFKVSDILVIKGNKYVVRGISDYSDFGDAGHTQLLVDMAA